MLCLSRLNFRIHVLRIWKVSSVCHKSYLTSTTHHSGITLPQISTLAPPTRILSKSWAKVLGHFATHFQFQRSRYRATTISQLREASWAALIDRFSWTVLRNAPHQGGMNKVFTWKNWSPAILKKTLSLPSHVDIKNNIREQIHAVNVVILLYTLHRTRSYMPSIESRYIMYIWR